MAAASPPDSPDRPPTGFRTTCRCRAAALAHSHDLLVALQPVMEYLFEQVRHSHNMVILANSRGVLIHARVTLIFSV